MSLPAGFGYQSTLQESMDYGRVLHVVLAPRQTHESWNHVREMLKKEVEERRPQSLLIDLHHLDRLYGAAMMGVLVVGAVAMQKLGNDRRTRIVAPTHLAAPLATIIRLAKIDVLFGGRVYPDAESALKDHGGARGEPTI